MISASSALCVLFALVFALSTLVDNNHRIRSDRLDSRKPVFYRWRDDAAMKVWRGIRRLRCWGGRLEKGTDDERRGLLEGSSVMPRQ